MGGNEELESCCNTFAATAIGKRSRHGEIWKEIQQNFRFDHFQVPFFPPKNSIPVDEGLLSWNSLITLKDVLERMQSSGKRLGDGDSFKCKHGLPLLSFRLIHVIKVLVTWWGNGG